VLEIGVDDLRLTDVELGSLDDRPDIRERVLAAGGWPALLGLLHARDPVTVSDYLWEEILQGLREDDRDTLVMLAAVGAVDPATLEALCGRAIDIEGFRRRVPLVHTVGDQLVLHDLWRDALAELVPGEELAAVNVRAARGLLDRRDIAGAGTVAARTGDVDLLGAAAVELVIDNVANLPVALAQRWLAAAADRDTPQLALLRSAARHARDATQPPPDELDALVEASRVDPSDAR
jgi:hypothetical protein